MKRKVSPQVSSKLVFDDHVAVEEPAEDVVAYALSMQDPTIDPSGYDLEYVNKTYHMDAIATFQANQYVEGIEPLYLPFLGDVEMDSCRELCVSLFMGAFSSQEKCNFPRKQLCSLLSIEAVSFKSDLANLVRGAIGFLDASARPNRISLFSRWVASLSDEGDRALIPLGSSSSGFLLLLIEPSSHNTYKVYACNRFHSGYHPMFLDANKIKVHPILCLDDVPKARMLHPTISSMLVDPTSKVLYEVVLPFLVGGRPLHQAIPEQFSILGQAVTAEITSSMASPVLVALRHVMHDDQEWRRFKLSFQEAVAERVLEHTGDFNSMELSWITCKLARAAIKSDCPPSLVKIPKHFESTTQQARKDEHKNQFETASVATMSFGDMEISISREL